MRKFWCLIIGVAAALVLGGVVMLLWNSIFPPVFNAGTLSYWQAVGLFILARLLFGRFGFGGRRHCRPPFWKQKWMQMSEEEREKFREEWHGRCGWGKTEQKV